MANQLPALPQGLTGAPLVTAINDRLRRIGEALGSTAVVRGSTTPGAPGILYGSHAGRINRPTPADATIFVESDRSSIVYQVRGTEWIYIAGTMQAAWASLPTDLGPGDKGFLFEDNTDSLHIWEWSGTAWTWGPGDRHSGEFGLFDVNPGAGWHLADGSAQTKYAANATRGSFTLPDMRGFFLLGSAVYAGIGVAAGGTTTAPFDNTLAGANAPALTGVGFPASFAVLPYYRL